MRAFVYCRVSTQEQAEDDHYSLANQEQRCRDYIKHKSWQLVKALKDVVSSKSAQRESCQELLQAIREQRIDVVVVYRLYHTLQKQVKAFIIKAASPGIA